MEAIRVQGSRLLSEAFQNTGTNHLGLLYGLTRLLRRQRIPFWQSQGCINRGALASGSLNRKSR